VYTGLQSDAQFGSGVGLSLTCPLLAHQMIERAREVYLFQGYALLVLFLVSCLIVGQTFFLLAWFFDWFIDFLYRVQRYLLLHLTLGSGWLDKAVGRLQGMPPKRNVRHLWRIVIWARMKKAPFEIRPVLKCQRMAATRLLKRKYGVTPSKEQWEWVDQEWQAWLAVLGKAPTGFREAFLTMRTFLSTAFAESVAMYVEPALRNWYFGIMTGTLLLAGCFQSLSLAKRRGEPMTFSLTRLLMLMEELAETSSGAADGKRNTKTSPGISISAGSDDDKDEDE
jgi:hypothetical protein